MGWVVVVLAIGMLIWVRLRLVTDIPRSVYAEPEQRAPAAQPERDAAIDAEDTTRIANTPVRPS